MSVSERFWTGAESIAESCLNHPFVRGLEDGTLSSERYAIFIGQDAFFLDVFARAYAKGVARAPDAEGRQAFHELEIGVFEELKLHATVSEELGIDLANVVPLEAARQYTDFLLANAFAGTLGELVSSMTPCMRLYKYLGVRLAEGGPSSDNYGDWIDVYSGDDFSGLVANLEALLDRYGEGTVAEEDRYRRAMELEYRFFDEAWNAGH